MVTTVPRCRQLAGQWMEQVQDVGGLALEEARSALRKDTTPLIYICATMWHESETEMVMMLKSIFRWALTPSPHLCVCVCVCVCV